MDRSRTSGGWWGMEEWRLIDRETNGVLMKCQSLCRAFFITWTLQRPVEGMQIMNEREKG